MSAPMTPEDFAERHVARGGVAKRQADGSYKVNCLAHEDRNPSLHVSAGRDGRLLLYCLAGCDQADVLLAEGLDWREIHGDARNGDGITATFDYVDADGHLLGQTVRKADGRRLSRRPDGAGGWIWDWKGVPRVLYRLPEVLRAVAEGRPVHSCEGESDADALVAAGEVATTAPFGAGARWQQAYSDALRGADVILWRDRDEPGRKRQAKVAAELEGVAASVLRVEPRDGKDARDHLAAGYGPWQFVKVGSEANRSERIFDMAQAMKDAAGPLPWRAKPVAMDGSVTLLVGRRSEHKTWLALFAAVAVHGGQALGPLAPTRGPALYLDIENGRRRMGRRFTVAGLEADALIVANGTGWRLPQDIGKVRALVAETGARLLVLDSLRRFAPSMKENDSDTAAPVLAALAELAQEADIAIVLIHHRSTKPGAPDVRGSSALEDQADIVWVLEKLPDDPERATRRRMRNTKMRDDAEHEPVWLSFETVGGLLTFEGAQSYEEGRSRAARERRRAEVLEVLGAHPRTEVGISDATGIPRTTVQRILQELGQGGQAEKTENGWCARPSTPVGEERAGTPGDAALFDRVEEANAWADERDITPPRNAIYDDEEEDA